MFASSKFIALCLSVVALSNGAHAEKEAIQTFSHRGAGMYGDAKQNGAGRGDGYGGTGAHQNGRGIRYGGVSTGAYRASVNLAGDRRSSSAGRTPGVSGTTGVRTNVGDNASAGVSRGANSAHGGVGGVGGTAGTSGGGTAVADGKASPAVGEGRTVGSNDCSRTASTH